MPDINYQKRYQQITEACVAEHKCEAIRDDPNSTPEDKRLAVINLIGAIAQRNFLLSKWGLI